MKRIFGRKVLEAKGDTIDLVTPNLLLNHEPFPFGVTEVGEPEGSSTENGAVINNGVLHLSPASGPDPGIVTGQGQSFDGLKNFNEGIQLGFGWVFDFSGFDTTGVVPLVNGGATFTTITINAAPAVSVPINVCRWGILTTICVSNFILSGGAGTPSVITLPAAIPIDYRPPRNTRAVAVWTANATISHVYATIFVNGDITFTALTGNWTTPYGTHGDFCVSFNK